MDPREALLSQFPAFFLLSMLFLLAHLRVRRRSAVRSTLWVLLFGAALAVSILFCILGLQAKYWTWKTVFHLRLWSWFGIALVLLALALRAAFRLQSRHARHMIERERRHAEKLREQAVMKAREEERAALAAQSPDSRPSEAVSSPSADKVHS